MKPVPWTRWTIAVLFGLSLFFVFTGCGKESNESNAARQNIAIKTKLAKLLDQIIANDTSMHGIVLRVEVPDRGLIWEGARGWADAEKQNIMVTGDLFRAASIGKMTCATLAMKLVENGVLGLDDKISHYLPAAIIDGLHVYQGTSYGQLITIRQLLNHTTGLADYVQDGDTNNNGIPDFIELLIENPGKFWTPAETIEYTKTYLSPLFPPGLGFHYSDTNYQLLGLIIEKITGKQLNEAYRDIIFNPSGMNHTYMEFYDSPKPVIPGRGLSHVYYGDLDYTDWKSVSSDWAGGGIATTAYDLSRFLRLYVDNGIFKNSATKYQMLNWTPMGLPGYYYGYGVERIVLDEIGYTGFGEIWGHEGFPNSFMFYWPQQNVIIVGTLNQALPTSITASGVASAVVAILKQYR